jgi:hypothetical protein
VAGQLAPRLVRGVRGAPEHAGVLQRGREPPTRAPALPIPREAHRPLRPASSAPSKMTAQRLHRRQNRRVLLSPSLPVAGVFACSPSHPLCARLWWMWVVRAF